MKSLGLAALGLSLIAATAASAQTTVTREISDMPVETTITRTPTQTIVTRRVLPLAETERVVVTTPPAMSRTVTTTVRSGAEPRRSARTATRAVTAQRSRAPVYAMATAEPIVLSGGERELVYRQIVERRTVPAQRGILAPIGSMFPVVSPTPTVAYAAPTVAYAEPLAPAVRTTYVVGSRLPAEVQLIELPESTIAQIPSLAPYAYALVGGRVLLVDPQTGMIVADITN